MIQNPVESVNALEKLANVIGKKTLVMWCIVTTFTTGYLFIDGRKTDEARLVEQKAAYERIVEEIKGMKKVQAENKKNIEETVPRIDTIINDAQETLNKLKKR